MALRNYLFVVGKYDLSGFRAFVSIPSVCNLNDGVCALRFINGTEKDRKFVMYGLTDGVDFLSELVKPKGYLEVEKDKVVPRGHIESAKVLVLPDGRVFVDEEMVSGGKENRERLRTVEKSAPELYREMQKMYVRMAL